MQLLPLKTYWNLGRSILATLYISMIPIFWTFVGAVSRKNADKILRSWASNLFKYVGLSYKVIGAASLRTEKNRAYIIMSNHASYYDIPLIYIAMPGSIRMIAKKELFKTPIWGRGMEAAEFISIDRKDRVQAMHDLEKAKSKMESGIMLWIAPEGTRTRTGKLLPFKKGGFMLAMQMKAIIIPVGLIGTREVMKADSWNVQYNREVKVKIGEPIDTTNYELTQRTRLIGKVRESIQTLIVE